MPNNLAIDDRLIEEAQKLGPGRVHRTQEAARHSQAVSEDRIR
jgi:hypothetical protein